MNRLPSGRIMGREGVGQSRVKGHSLLVPLALLAAALFPWRTGADTVGPTDHRLGRVVDDFALIDPAGQTVTLKQFDDAPVLVIAFLGVECPLAKLYAPRLAELFRELEPAEGGTGARAGTQAGVRFLAIDANVQDTRAEIGQFHQAHALPFPLLQDPSGALADRLGAERTPEVFVLDHQRVVRYVGRIDDQFGIAYQAPSPTRRDLALAIADLRADRPVTVPAAPAIGCRIGRESKPDPTARVTWANSVAHIVQKHCQDCHRPGQIGPFSLLTYEDTLGWGATIAEVVAEGRMPPWHADPRHGSFANDPRLSDREKADLADWIAAGSPRGDPGSEPPPRQFTAGWQIEHPDQVVFMSDEPFQVPAEGIVEYQWFEADPGFTEDKWIKAVECRPGNPAVVHHVTVYFAPPGGSPLRLRDRINLVGGFAPGKRSLQVPWDGTAKFVPAGSKFRFEMHYTTNGTPQTDRSSIALLFADPKEVKQQLSVVLVANETFAIPPGAADYQVQSEYVLDEDSALRVLSPHMHLRGKAFRFDALWPDGRRETLLQVPRFDFNWQTDYLLAEPKHLPAGSTIQCVATFDNSPANRSNPDPTATVRWGEQTWEEMMIGAITITPVGQDLTRGVGPGIHYPRRHWWWPKPIAAGGLVIALLVPSAWLLRRRLQGPGRHD